jgi:hypothetical protein
MHSLQHESQLVAQVAQLKAAKSLESKFGFRKAKYGGKAWLDVVEPAEQTFRMTLRSRLPGNEARSDHDAAAALQSKA